MNKTFTINLNGRVYNINDDAYEVLNEYLDSLKNIFASEEGASEIMEDIEARIGELFSERMRYGMQVIGVSDVQDMIKIMGNPGQIENEDNTDIDIDDSKNSSYSGDASVEPEEETTNKQTGKTSEKNGEKRIKRLFRNPDNRVIAGVCSGLGCYLSVDPIIIRILFIISLIFSFGMTLLLYAILWAIMPEAKSVAQKLQMKGEEANVENIRQAINEGEIAQSGGNHSTLGVVLGFIVKLVAILAIVTVVITLLPMLFFLIPFLFIFGIGDGFGPGGPIGPMGHMPFGNGSFTFSMTTLPFMQVIFYIACVLLALIPIATLVQFILVKNNKSKPMNGSLKLTVVLIWIVALIFVVSRFIIKWIPFMM